jgi:hypothetical protein
MVSGFRTSPLDCSRMCSGEARLMMILVKFDLIFISFLVAIFLIFWIWNEPKNAFTYFSGPDSINL